MGRALLIIVLGFSAIFGMTMFNVTANQQRSSRAILQQYENWLRRNAKETATNVGISKLYQNPNWTGTYNGSFGGATFTVTSSKLMPDSAHVAKGIQLTTSVTYDGIADTTTAVYFQPAYSYFYDFFHKWNPAGTPARPRYSTGDTVVAPIYVKERIRTTGSPVFMSKVVSSNATIDALSGAPVFYDDIELGTATILLDNSVVAALIDTIIVKNILPDTDEIWLTLMGASYKDSIPNLGILSTGFITDLNGVLMTGPGSNQDIHVQGTIDGQLTIYSDRDIRIENNITYATANAFLGLIAKRNVTVADNFPNSTNVIHATIMALENFNVEHYDTLPSMGTLTIFGSLIRKNWRPTGVGTTNGYVLNHVYDPRLRIQTPPYFPRITNRNEKFFRSD